MILKKHGSKKAVREALRRALLRGLVLNGKIETYESRGKVLKNFADEIINTARKGTLAARRSVLAKTGGDKDVTNIIFAKITPNLNGKTSGFTRLVRLGQRLGDATMMVSIEWTVETNKKVAKVETVAKAKRDSKSVTSSTVNSK